MERELWPRVYQELVAAARGTRQKHVHYHPWVIAAVLVWAALHDRPVAWACRAENWSTTHLRPPELPSPATVSRRAARLVFAVFLNRVADRLRGDGPPAWVLVVDGKPLPVGRCSKDPDARGTPLGRGYKLHVVWGDRAWPEAWAVTALREYEGAVACRLLAGVAGRGVLLGDGAYEASRVYDAAAAAGYQLLAPTGPHGTGGGHQYQSPHRLLRWLADGPGRAVLRGRAAIERRFGNLGAFPGGLGPLPNWVRRHGRVERWVWCKLIINAHRILRNRERMQQMQ